MNYSLALDFIKASEPNSVTEENYDYRKAGHPNPFPQPQRPTPRSTSLAHRHHRYRHLRRHLWRQRLAANRHVRPTTPIFWQVPDDTLTMRGSRSAGVPLLLYAPKSHVQQSITGLVRALIRSSTVAHGEFCAIRLLKWSITLWHYT